MPKQIVSRFTAYEFTQAELFSATRFSDLSIMLIQTLIAEAAIRRTNLHYDSMNPTNFLQQEAEIAGEIGILEHILTLMLDTPAPEKDTAQEKAEVAKPVTQPATPKT